MSFRKLALRLLVLYLVYCAIGIALEMSGENGQVTTGIKIASFAFLGSVILFVLPLRLVRRFWKKKVALKDLRTDQKAKITDRFIRNTPAMLGVFTIIYATLLSIFAHVIAPDSSPNAGEQINEIAYKKPGFSIDILRVPNDRQPEKQSWLKTLLNGKPSGYNSIPITRSELIGDTLTVTRYIGDGVGQQRVFSISALTGIKGNEDQQLQALHKHNIDHRTFWLGTDDLGRDYLSRILLGIRVSLSVGVVAVLIALFIGVPLGAIAGYYRQHPPQWKLLHRIQFKLPVDGAVMWLINIIWSIPTLLLVFPIVFAFGQQYYTIFIAVGLTMWVDIARMVRGQVMQVREMEFVQAAKTFGYSDTRTIWRHILPNIMGPVIVITAANFAYAILTEAGLSFLGIGVQPPAPSWGLMISKYKDNLITEPYLPLIPGFAITLIVLAFFMVGNGLRDALDLKSRF